MTDEKYRTWDIIFKSLSLVGVLGGAWWTVHTYLESRTKDQNSFIFERQASLYLDAARAAATIAADADARAHGKNVVDEKTLQTARERFEQLYLGELVLVEDRRVELAMIAFHSCLPDTPSRCGRPGLTQYGKPIAPEKDTSARNPKDLKEGGPSLHDLSLELGACTRSALQEDRKIQFGAIKAAITVCPYD